MAVITENAIIIPDRPIKLVGTTACVYVPKEFLGKRATVIIHLDEIKIIKKGGKVEKWKNKQR